MADLLQEDCTIILKHPLNNLLDPLRVALQKVKRLYKSGAISHDGVIDVSAKDFQKPVSRLLDALMGFDTAFYLRFKYGNQNMAFRIADAAPTRPERTSNTNTTEHHHNLYLRRHQTLRSGTPSSILQQRFLR